MNTGSGTGSGTSIEHKALGFYGFKVGDVVELVEDVVLNKEVFVDKQGLSWEAVVYRQDLTETFTISGIDDFYGVVDVFETRTGTTRYIPPTFLKLVNSGVDADTVDMVNSPPHYTAGNIEVIAFIEDKGFGYNLGNAIKYISRCEHKGNKEQDLNKAIWYLQRELKQS